MLEDHDLEARARETRAVLLSRDLSYCRSCDDFASAFELAEAFQVAIRCPLQSWEGRDESAEIVYTRAVALGSVVERTVRGEDLETAMAVVDAGYGGEPEVILGFARSGRYDIARGLVERLQANDPLLRRHRSPRFLLLQYGESLTSEGQLDEALALLDLFPETSGTSRSFLEAIHNVALRVEHPRADSISELAPDQQMDGFVQNQVRYYLYQKRDIAAARRAINNIRDTRLRKHYGRIVGRIMIERLIENGALAEAREDLSFEREEEFLILRLVLAFTLRGEIEEALEIASFVREDYLRAMVLLHIAEHLEQDHELSASEVDILARISIGEPFEPFELYLGCSAR